MPATPTKNLIYRAALPVLAPSVRGRLTHRSEGIITLKRYEKLLVRHHVCGASLLLRDGDRTAYAYTSCDQPRHASEEKTIFRVASITKMAAALVTLKMQEEGALTLDTPVNALLPPHTALEGVTVGHLLSHTGGLADPAGMDGALQRGESFHTLLDDPACRACRPGKRMIYSNFGFGLLGCILEQLTGESVESVFQDKLFRPLGMRATLDGSTLEEADIMPITRVLPYHPGRDVTVTALGRIPLTAADPLRHFGHTAGAMYTDCASLSLLLDMIHHQGAVEGRQLLSPDSIRQMTTRHAATPTRVYGLGLVLLQRPEISDRRLLGHQGFAYGCVDGAFVEEGTGRQVIFLNGGASEARQGRLGLVNRDVLRWALREEMPAWK